MERVIISLMLIVLMISFVSSAFGLNTGTQGNYGFNKNNETSTTTIISGGGSITTFLDLLDTPNSYIGEGTNCVIVNAGETALEFGSCGAGGGGGNTTEEIQDAVGSGFTGNLSYDDAGNKFDVDSTNLLGWLDNIYVRISNIVSLVGNWSADKNNYYNKTEVDTNITNANTSIYNWIVAQGYGAGGNYAPTNINLTAGTHDGDIENGTAVGYEAGDAICDAEFSGSHFCTEFEVALYQGDDIDGEDAWIIAGSPKYIPATVPVNDCQGWTYSGTTTALGNYWHFESDGKGEGRAINCGSTLKLACCSY